MLHLSQLYQYREMESSLNEYLDSMESGKNKQESQQLIAAIRKMLKERRGELM